MWPDAALQFMLNYLLQDVDLTWTYHLYKNDYTPVAGSVLGDFTESTFTGYAEKAAVTEAAVTVNAGHEANSLGAEMTWTCTANGAAQQAFGIYITFHDIDDATVRLGPAWRFDAPTTIAFNGDFVKKKTDFYAKSYAP